MHDLKAYHHNRLRVLAVGSTGAGTTAKMVQKATLAIFSQMSSRISESAGRPRMLLQPSPEMVLGSSALQARSLMHPLGNPRLKTASCFQAG